MDNGFQRMVGFGAAFKLYFTNYVNFEGRSTRAEFWWTKLWNFFVWLVVVIGLVYSLVEMSTGNQGVGIPLLMLVILVAVVWGLGTIIPNISLHVRRYRDAGVNPLLLLVVYLGPMVIGFFTNVNAVMLAAMKQTTTAELGSIVGASSIYSLLVFAIGVFDFVVTVLPSTDTKRLG